MEDLENREVVHLIGGRLDDLNAWILWSPKSGVSGTKKQSAGQAAGGSEVADTTIVA